MPSPRHSPSLGQPSSSSSPRAGGYAGSLPPTYRLSSFPVSPKSALPAGLSLAQHGCASDGDDNDDDPALLGRAALTDLHSPRDVQQQHHRTTRGFDCPAASSSASSSRKSSAASLGLHDQDPDHAAPPSRATSPASTAPSSVAAGSAPSSPSMLSQLALGGRAPVVVQHKTPADEAALRKEREARAGRSGWEDPALAAARRALWDDPVDEAQQETPKRADSAAGDAAARGETGDAQGEAADDEAADEGDFEEGSDVEPEDEDDEAWEPPLPRRAPCHTTMTPRASCLRYSPAARSLSLSTSASSSAADDAPSHCGGVTNGRHSPSAASTASTSAPSVSFSCEPPLTCPTYSAVTYERKGDAPVEKLSIREWIELQGVREAVGVWSGKIAKWDEVLRADEEAEAQAARGRSACPLAAVVGVVHVSRSTPSSPIDGPLARP
ncbi:uncharacterized protein JCM10292_001867 [Rhodotorula paludigena]|uniref:uncharacterized protein n=1 Tax=Rhodotorula paludigena TaxID=86838 RepID=UPI003176C126